MMFSQSFGGLETVMLGIGILFVAFLLRRSSVLSRRSRQRDPAAEVRREFLEAERSGASRIELLEIRLHDFGREVEARMDTRITILDQLTLKAEDEIERLQALLNSSARLPTDPQNANDREGDQKEAA